MLVVYSRRHRKLPSSDDHLIGNVCDYKEEGGGEADQGRYDIVALRKPVFPSDYSLNGSATKTMRHLNGSIPMSRMNGKSDADLDAFLQDRLGDMDGDLDGLYDEVRRYAVETDNISVISLSSLSSNDSSLSELDDDRLNDWGPKFKFIADAFRYDKNRKLD
uniref:Cadherin Y-type LIR-motif domain-containing protein n=1 Tax=Romanomermis culicivorax TaxID=13658 RepID=A0A915JDH0_ROMCU